jgi:hypothetical protein
VSLQRHTRVGYISQGKIVIFFLVICTLYATVACLLLGYRYWEPTYEDSLNLIARLPGIAAYIYRRYVKHIFLIKIKHLTCNGVGCYIQK